MPKNKSGKKPSDSSSSYNKPIKDKRSEFKSSDAVAVQDDRAPLPDFDDEDLIETLEVNLKEAGLLGGELSDVEKRLKTVEVSFKEISDKITDFSANQEELFKRVSMVTSDSQDAAGDSGKVLNEVNKFKEDTEQSIAKLSDLVENLKSDISAGIEIFDEISNLKGLIKRVEKLETAPDELSKNYKKLETSVNKIIDQLGRQKERETGRLKAETGHLTGDEKLISEKINYVEDTLIERIDSIEDKFDELKTSLSGSVESFDNKFKKLQKFQDGVSDKIYHLNEAVEKGFKGHGSSKAPRTSPLPNNIEEMVESCIEKRFKSLKDEIKKSIDSKTSKIDKFEERLEAVGDNLHIEMEILADEIKSSVKEGGSGPLDPAKFGQVTGEFAGKLKTVEDSIRELKEKMEGELKEKLDPMYDKVQDISGGLDKTLEPIRKEVASAKRFIEEEMIKVKESWEKVDKTISDSEGAMLIAQRAKESLERMEKEVTEAIRKAEDVMAVLKENTLKTDANSDKIDLTIKLIDEARERIKTVQSIPAVPGAIAAAAPNDINTILASEDFIFTAKEILEAPDAATMEFDLDDLLQVMIKHNASDLHLKANVPPIVRLEGELIPVGNKVLTEEDCKKLVLSAMTPGMRKQLGKKHEVDFAYALPEARFRVNAFLQKQSISAAFRLLWTDIPTVEKLSLPPVIKRLCDHKHGLILVTGPAGNGKSTTLASMVNYLNESKKMHIVTIEDPIEFIHNDKMSIITQREIGTDTESFAVALKQSLRQDPNVILIGEMRDPETIMTAVVAAETGHLVLSTLHTPNTTQAVNRIIDVFSGDLQKQFRLLLSNTLRGIVSQRLLNRADESGRIPAVEVLVVTQTISSLILEGRTNDIYEYLMQGQIDGMQTFTQSLMQLYEQGLITREEAMYHADQPTELRLVMEGHSTGSASAMQDDSLMSWL